MDVKIVPISKRGQLTLPASIRKDLKADAVMCCWSGNNVVLQPVRTREQFLAELAASKQDWETHGGPSWEEVMKKAGL